MEYFKHFVSNCVAGSANQFVFESAAEEICVGRIFYRIQTGGEFMYSLLFSNVLDSTYSNGAVTRCNFIPSPWRIHEAKVYRCTSFPQGKPKTVDPSQAVLSEEAHPLLFEGKKGKSVAPGEFFTTDPTLLSFEQGDYLCLELHFSGTLLPYHEESLLPIFRKTPEGWVYDRRMPVPGMIGCDRKVKRQVVFLGDSITQGSGAPDNSYLHWNALVADALSGDTAFWNLGIGYARASDAASDGAWLYKVKKGDFVVLCLGTNDVLQGHSAAQIKSDLSRIVSILQKKSIPVLAQTLPPFNYGEAHRLVWEEVNAFVREELPKLGARVFDVVPTLGLSPEEPHRTPYGGHPNEEGSRLWAEALLKASLI